MLGWSVCGNEGVWERVDGGSSTGVIRNYCLLAAGIEIEIGIVSGLVRVFPPLSESLG